jgi:hypothetical protein
MIAGKTDDQSFGKARARGLVGIPSKVVQTGDESASSWRGRSQGASRNPMEVKQGGRIL